MKRRGKEEERKRKKEEKKPRHPVLFNGWRRQLTVADLPGSCHFAFETRDV
jgi:hypothetical protein